MNQANSIRLADGNVMTVRSNRRSVFVRYERAFVYLALFAFCALTWAGVIGLIVKLVSH